MTIRSTIPRDVRCPYCSAPAGVPCRRIPPGEYHGSRAAAARRAAEAVETATGHSRKLRINRDWLKP